MHALTRNEYIEKVIEKYADMVYRLAISRTRNKENAEDVFQEVFLRLSRKLPNFESDEHEKAWIIRVTINCSKNIITSSWNTKTTALDDNIKSEEPELNEVYYEVLKLPKKERTILHLFYYEGLKLAEIGKVLGITEKNAKTRLFRARKKLKERLGEFDNE